MLLLFNTTRTTSGPAQLLHGAQNGALVAQSPEAQKYGPDTKFNPFKTSYSLYS